MIKTLTAQFFKPSNALTGEESPTVLRGENMVLRGVASGNPYFECRGQDKNLGEDYNINTAAYKLTGTVAFDSTTNIVTGTGTAFLAELHIGQMFLAGNEVFAVSDIISDTSFVAARPPATTQTAQIGRRLPQMFEILSKRGVQLTGNAIQFEKGHIVSVGSGELFINGSLLAGTSLIASSKPQIAIYRASTNDYVVRDLGFPNPPPSPVVNVVSGGTKGMADGNYSMMISYWSPIPEGTDGFSNPSPVVKLDGTAAKIEINTTGGKTRFEIDFTNSLVGMPSNAGGFLVFFSLAGRKTVNISGTTTTTSSPNQTNYENGPWYKVAKVKVSDLVSNKFLVEFLDSEAFEEVTGDNDAPPNCEYVALIEGKPLYISAYGKRKTGGSVNGSNPGPMCVVSKFGNPDGAPTEWGASLTHNIIGWFEGVGRWFMMTASTLDFIVSTGLLGQSFQGGQQLELPIISRPYWKTGAANRYSIILIDDTLYGASGSKLFKSVGNGDENIQKYEFGSPVEDITRNWSPGHILTAHDAKNNNLCFIYSGAYKNAAGFWVSIILPYSLYANAWLPLAVISDDTRDMIVSGVAVVNERLEFLAGGRVSGGTFVVSTFRYDEEDAAHPLTSMPYYLVWQPTDDGQENMSKQIKSIRPEGKFTQMKIQIHGARPGGQLKISDMEAGTNSLSGDIAFPDTSEITLYLKIKLKIRNLGIYALRLSGVWNGAGKKDRLEELAIDVEIHGKER